MLIDFFFHLRSHRLPVSVKEYLTLVDALRHGLGAVSYTHLTLPTILLV